MASISIAQQQRTELQNRQALERAAINLNRVLARAKLGGVQALNVIGVELSTLIRARFRPGEGRLYTRRGVTHRASRAGAPPAVDTGRLRSSYTFRVGTVGGGRAYVDVGTNVKYARFLEFGTIHMRPRPHFRPTVNAYRRQISARIKQGWTARAASEIAKLPKGPR
jgi:HK97 gp10 family phage protein